MTDLIKRLRAHADAHEHVAPQTSPPDADRREVFLRVMYTGSSATELRVGELFSCWRPLTKAKRPWRDARVWSAIDALVAEGSLTRRTGMVGDVLSVTDGGVLRYSATREALNAEARG